MSDTQLKHMKSVRKPMPKPPRVFKDKTKYTRKPKHK
jgi:hypothetical protein